jgi:hypothetical protein
MELEGGAPVEGRVGVSPTSIVIATLGRDDSAFTLGAVAAVQTTIWFPFQ